MKVNQISSLNMFFHVDYLHFFDIDLLYVSYGLDNLDSIFELNLLNFIYFYSVHVL